MSYLLMKNNMKTTTLSNRNSSCQVYFDGEYYIFIDSFKGIFAVAIRKGFAPELSNQFVIYYGNDYNHQKSDDVADLKMAEKEITRQENQYVETKVTFEPHHALCNVRFGVTLKINRQC